MKTLIAFIIICICLSGCAKVVVIKNLPDGSYVRAEYTRIFNQSIEKFKLKTPEGWEVSFDKQESETEMAFRLGILTASIGRTD